MKTKRKNTTTKMKRKQRNGENCTIESILGVLFYWGFVDEVSDENVLNLRGFFLPKNIFTDRKSSRSPPKWENRRPNLDRRVLF